MYATRASVQADARIAPVAASVEEGSPATFTVTLTQAQATDVTVGLAATGSVIEGPAPTSVTIAANETSTTLSVPTVFDPVVGEGGGAVSVTLQAGEGYRVGTPVTASVAVSDKDAVFAVAASPASLEEGERSTVEVSVSNGVTFATAQTISLTVSGTAAASDYRLPMTSLTLPVGAQSAAVRLTAVNDVELEVAETVVMAARHGGVELGSATVTIEANDGPKSTFDHSTAFPQLLEDRFSEHWGFLGPNSPWYGVNYNFAKYAGYQDLLAKHDRHLPAGRGLTILQAESTHTPDDLGNVAHLFGDPGSSDHSRAVAALLTVLPTSTTLYSRYRTFSQYLDSFHASTTTALRTFLSSRQSGDAWYPATSHDGAAVTPAKLLNVSNSNGGSRADLVRRFDKFVEENDMVACTAMSSNFNHNWTTSGNSYNSLVVGGANVRPRHTRMNDHGGPRYKPDIVTRSGLSDSTTSYSSPTVCSAAAVLLERARVDGNVANAYNSVVTKAILMAGATRFDYRITVFWEKPWHDDDYAIDRTSLLRHPLFLSGNWVRDSSGVPTDRQYGAGSLNMLGAYDILDAGEFDAEGTVPVGVRGWDYARRLAVGDSVTYPMSIARESMFSAVLAWHRYVDDSIVSHLPDYELSVYDANGVRVALSDSTTSNVELVETKLAPGTYQMKVRVKSDGGSTDELSYGLAWTTKEVLAQPTSVAVAKSGRNWTVSWDRQANRKYRVVVARDAAHTDVVKEVYRPRSGIASDAASYAYSIPADRTPRHFRVYAYPKDGRVAYEYPSEPVALRSPAPGLVTGLVATANGDDAIDLSWSAPEYGGPTTITGYWIEWSADGESGWTSLTTTAGTATRYTDRGLGAETTRHYRASAVNASGKGPASVTASATTEEEISTAPEITSPSTFEVAEGTTAVATLAATDVDTAVAELEWSIPSGAAGGADRDRFALTTRGVLSFTAAKDFEAPDDAGNNRSYQVTVRVFDTVETDTADLTVTLTNVNEAPRANAGEDLSGIEPGTLITLDGSGEDPDAGDSLTYLWSQTAGANVTLSDTAAPRPTFTAPDNLTESETLAFTLRVSDALGLSHEDSVSVTVAPNSVPLTASFENVPETHDGSMAETLRLRFSEDVILSYRAFTKGLFSITNGTIGRGSRVTLGSSIAWDFPVTPAGQDDVVIDLPAGRDCNAQQAPCTADGRRLSAPARATIAGPGTGPEITSPSTFEVAEGTTVVATLTATDTDTGSADLEWLIPADAAGGSDRAQFALTAAGALSFATAKDFEAPDDAGNDGSYQVTVQVSDGGRTDTADLTVTLTNVNEAPTANAGEDLSGIEPGALVTLDGSGEDPDAGDSLTYLWSQTAGDNVTLSDTAARRPTFTAPDNLTEAEELTFTLRVTDALELSHEDSVSVTVLPNRPPLTASFENVPETHDGLMAETLRLRFSEDVILSYRAFTNGLFSTTNGTIGTAIRVTQGSSIAWDFPVTPTGRDDVVIDLPAGRDCDSQRAPCTADGRRLSAPARATIAGPAAGPEITSPSTFEVAEGTTVVATLTATDTDTGLADLEWSIPADAAGGSDRAQFTLTAAGALSFATAKDFEAPDDAGNDGSYQVTVQVTDGGRTDTADLTVTLTNVNEAPTANAGADQSEVEPGSLVTLDGSGEDPDAGDSLTYLWSQTAGDSVTLSDTAARRPTFTAPDNLTEAEELTFTLRVTDAADLSDEDSVTVTIAAAASASPVVTVEAGTSPVTEGTPATFTIRLDQAAGEALSVTVSVLETGDFLSEPAPTSVAFASGDQMKDLVLGTTDDGVIESDGTVTATVRAGDGYTLGSAASASVTVADNDTAEWRISAENAEIDEGGSTPLVVELTNSKTFAAEQSITLTASGTAAASDYEISPTPLTLAAGATSVSATLTALDDTTEESAETVTVAASHGGSRIGAATVTIRANDTPPGQVTGVTVTEQEGSLSVTWTAVVGADGYRVQWREDGGTYAATRQSTVSGGLTSETIGELEAGTLYWVQVAAMKTGAEEGPWSTEMSGTPRASGTEPEEGDLRLVGGAEAHEGRVEIYHESQWGTVCDDNWRIVDARVACRQLGYSDANSAPRQARFGEGVDPIWMDEVQCEGTETTLADCPFYGWGVHNCRHSEDASAVCTTGTDEGAGANAGSSPLGVGAREHRALAPEVVVTAPSGDAVTFAEVVDAALGGSPASDLQVLDLTDYKLGDLSGIERLSGLRVLLLRGNAVVDISPLAGLGGLRELDLSDNAVAELWPLAGLAELRRLDLSDNAVADISPLMGLERLSALALDDNAVTDLSPLAGLPSLERLRASRNAIGDVSPLTGLTGLRELALSGNAVLDVWPLARLSGLEHLYLAGNAIEDPAPLARLSGLRTLDLARNRIGALDGLSPLVGVLTLKLDRNRLSALYGLAGLASLEALSLRGNAVEDVGPLADLRNLRLLDVRDNPVSDLGPLARRPVVVWVGDLAEGDRGPARRVIVEPEVAAPDEARPGR